MDEQLVMRIPAKLKKALIAIAEKERRTLSDFLRLELEKIIEEFKAKNKK